MHYHILYIIKYVHACTIIYYILLNMNICTFVAKWVMRFLRPFGVLMKILKSSKMGPHLVLILLKSTLFFPMEKLLTSSPQNKIPFTEALYYAQISAKKMHVFRPYFCKNEPG